MTVLAVLNQKGGVGKTTLAVNLAYHYAHTRLAQGSGKTDAALYRVLVVDVDKQGAASSSLLAAELTDDHLTLADALADDRHGARLFQSAVQAADPQWGPIHVVPASLDLEDVWASQRPGMIFRLRRLLDEAGVHDAYDMVILDGPPDLGPGTVAACVAADAVIVPTRPERMSLHGVARTVETVEVVRRDMRPDVQLAGIVGVAVDRRVNEHQARIDELHHRYGRLLLDTLVPHRLRSDEASGAGVPASQLGGTAGPTFESVYQNLVAELTQRLGDPEEREQDHEQPRHHPRPQREGV